MKEKRNQDILIGLVVLFTIVLPVLAVVVGIFLFKTIPYEYLPFKEKMEVLRSKVVVTPESEVVKPSEVLADKKKYANRQLVVRGRVSEDQVVCERSSCPKDDSCCGCPLKKNLIVSDADLPFLSDQPRNLPLFSPEEESLCVREPGSCDYNCSGWQIGSVYDLEGTFFVEAPIAGSGIQIWDFYFSVEGKTQDSQAEGMSFFDRISGNLKEIIKQLRTSGYYVR
jgi:hypothetical protein